MNLDLFDSPRPEVAVWTVSELNRAVRGLLEGAMPPLWVSGEVANWKRAGSGHCYFTLKDEAAQVRCVMWRTEAARLPTDPGEGMRVRAHGQLTLYEARGDYQLVVRALEGEEGEGLWKLAFERLKGKLEAEGLLAPERRRPIPRLPQCVGVVTSTTGAALHDILTVLRRRAPWLRVLVRGTRVQGEGAAEEIARAVRVLAGTGLPEVLIVGRGGGSREDLWAFNEEPVARALAECPVPVISAVGHEVDVTISDLVADLRAPTPSAAAEAVAPAVDELRRHLRSTRERLARGLRRGVEGRRRRLEEGKAGLRRGGRVLMEPRRRRLEQVRSGLHRAGRALVEPRRRVLDQTRIGLQRAVRSLVERRRHALARLGGKMDALSPLATLRRGYAVPLGAGGRVLRGVEDFNPGEAFELRVVDGRVGCQVRDIQKDEV